ncbi:MAG TPA: hypothetical protein ENI85_12770 [Deltaproteobacteria bacterium]|nr:hypothetical protein [Deltaproteobacteria bacterium]
MIPPLFALAFWVVVPLILFYMLRPHLAAILTLLSATLFLPVGAGFNLPVLPTMGKEEIASLACMLCAMGFAGDRLVRARPLRGPELLLVLLSLGTILSVLNNQDRLYYGPVVVPGIEITGFVSDILEDLLRWGFPFFIGRALFVRSEHLKDLLAVFIFAGLVYSLLILFEIRMSPQLHRWTYGYHQHGFSQTIRSDGSYRPMVYMRHGLHVALFIFLCMTAAWTFFRTRYRLPLIPFVPKGLVAGYLSVILVMEKSLGAVLYGLVVAPLVIFTSTRIQILAAVAIAMLCLSYPALRLFRLIPVESVVEFAETEFGHDRAHSLAGRLRTEDQMMQRIQERPLFGWASSGRPMVRSEVSGRTKTVYDGVWVILLVKGGIVRFLCIFGLLLAPVFLAFLRMGMIRSKQDRIMIAGLSLMVAINVFDLLPNSTVEGYLTLMSGVLAGVVPGILAEQQRRRPAGGKSPSGRRGGDVEVDPFPDAAPSAGPGSTMRHDEAGGAGLGKALLGSPAGRARRKKDR